MIDCSLILSVSVILFSILILSWWEFFSAVYKVAPENYIANEFAAVIFEVTYIWTIYTFFCLALTIADSSYHLFVDTNYIGHLSSNILFIMSLALIVMNTLSNIALVKRISIGLHPLLYNNRKIFQ